jgi:hypothetical protein
MDELCYTAGQAAAEAVAKIQRPEGREESPKMIDTSSHLAELSNLAQTLNKETDSYTAALTHLENKLRKMNLGVEGWVTVDETDFSGTPMRSSTMRTMLGFAKTVPDGWGIAVKEVRVERGFYEGDESCPWEMSYEEDQPKALLKSSRELRILASRRIEALLSELRDQARAAIKSLQEARKVAEQI